MHPYLPHLLSDIAAAHCTEMPEPKYLKTFEEEMEAVEQWCEGEEYAQTFGYYCGLRKDQFPPVNQLTEDDFKLLNDAFQKMMHTWNLGIDMPKNLPVSFAYTLLVDTLDKKTIIPDTGFVTFDFCTGYAPDCDLKQYCPCLKYWDDPLLS